eukprot:COSAG04_NODE_9339_length_872_cov_1.692109_1_plen_58_part_10
MAAESAVLSPAAAPATPRSEPDASEPEAGGAALALQPAAGAEPEAPAPALVPPSAPPL